MTDTLENRETLLAQVDEGDEHRVVSLVVANDLAVLECTEGPVTEAAYGSWSHGHKVLCGADAYARVLGVAQSNVAEALTEFFAGGLDGAQLSDLMDAFDQAGERYSYLAWTGGGDAVMRR